MEAVEDRLLQAQRSIRQLHTDVAGRRNRRDLLREQLEKTRLEVSNLEQESEDALAARHLFEHLAEHKREIVRDKIELLVTHGIQSVFGPTYEFKIEQAISRNQVTFEYKIIHEFNGEKRVSDLRGYHGGGLVALVGFLLRLVMVLYTRPARRRILFLDETMAALDGDKRQSFGALLRGLGDTLGVQFVLITHSPEYTEEADKVYLVTPAGDGISKLVLQD